MVLDSAGNLYITERRLDNVSSKEILVLNSSGNEVCRIKFPEVLTNICADKENNGFFYVTAGKGLYYLKVKF
jgi:hypothetical protein